MGDRAAWRAVCRVGLPAAIAIAAFAWPSAASAEVVWLCHPEEVADNPCEIPLDTTVESGAGSEVVTPRRIDESRRPIDCFYVYPTVSNQPGTNATQSRDPEIVSIAKYQAARFSTECRMFAPIYRQIPLAGLAGLAISGPGSPSDVAFQSVLEAWRDYLANDNDGRGVVLIGHSQGTIMLRQLIRTEIEKNPQQLRLFAGGLLMGGNVTVAEGRRTGGDFAKVRTCLRPSEVGCVVAYSTYSTDPGSNTFFGNTNTDNTGRGLGLPSGPGYEVACTDPGDLHYGDRPFGVTIPTEPFAPGPINLAILSTNGGPPPTAPTTWVEAPDRYRGACRTINGANVFRYDPEPGSRRPNETPPEWGTHLIDVNLGLERLRTIARRQASSYLADRTTLSKARRNRRMGIATARVTVPGPGRITLAGTGVRRRAVEVSGPRKVKLKIALRGAAKRKLRKDGRKRVRIAVSYEPEVGSGVHIIRNVRLLLKRP